MATANDNRTKKPLRLPFDSRRDKRGDWASWIYRHRIGLLVTVVVYLSLAIMFVTYKIVVQQVPVQSVEIEFQEMELIEEVVEQEDEIQQIEDYYGGRVDNRISNADSKFNETLRDSKNSNASEIYDEAERVQRELAEGQERFRREMQELEGGGRQDNTVPESNVKSKDGDRNQDAFVGGNVTVSFSLDGRTALYLDIPAYKCMSGGKVVVNISVNRNGYVTSASVERSTSTSDNCLHREAVASAKASTFNVSASAPDSQKGSITYVFVAQ
ncbi:MAG: energy transducer TonB [Rikenellaceae bacterium]